jgi:nitronate monooxygenase
MFDFNGIRLDIGGLIAPLPIVQGAMGIGVSMAGLASAVANEGGVGVLSAAGIGMLRRPHAADPARAIVQALSDEIALTRSKMRAGLLGINIMTVLSDFSQIVRASAEASVDIIFSGAGLPLDLPKYASRSTRLVPIVSSSKAVQMISRWWQQKYQRVPDAFVLEGPLAGGHLGFRREQLALPEYQLEALISPVRAQLDALEQASGRKIPLIAGGGIFSGGDIHRILSLGACAVQMATRFVATEECDADHSFKEAYIRCRKEDIAIIDSPVGMPGRAIKNAFLAGAANGESAPKKCPWHCINSCDIKRSPYCISLALLAACKGRLEQGFAFIGANGYRIDSITTVHRLLETLHQEFLSVSDPTCKGES